MPTFLLPIEGLAVTSPWEIGRVQLHPGANARTLLGPEAEHWFTHEIAGDVANLVADELEQGTVAQVEAPDVDEALDLVTLATDLLRIFQKKSARFRTTMFGLPGQVHRSNVRYFAAGETGGPAFRNRGEVLGSILSEERRAAWQASRTFSSLAAQVGADGPLDEGPRRALLGVQFLSQAILEHRPGFKILNLVIALESMLLERNPGPQTLRLLRRVTYFTCSRACDSMCGRDRAACQFLALDPAVRENRQQLEWLRKLAENGLFWRCDEWLSYAHWYELRSSVAHGDDEPVTVEEASQAEYWIFTWTVEPVLQWLVEHPVNPLGELDQALAALEPVPDWQHPVPNPDTYEPGNHPAS
jgi:hypothetical protein